MNKSVEWKPVSKMTEDELLKTPANKLKNMLLFEKGIQKGLKLKPKEIRR